eukprot:TRINITY_DN136521_c0_g1_i1.p1 TRINITY_DN136521_c0_g1~~TRINITY_DN136521_c0_g1_i1.p1  ORF type:complete len:62 (+),score=18.94 TRINITY_DN136521_c0_g1_i1:20-205(+)
MAKRRNHTNENQNAKQHKNGIKKPRRHRYKTCRGMYKPFLRNRRYARKWNNVPGGRKGQQE